MSTRAAVARLHLVLLLVAAAACAHGEPRPTVRSPSPIAWASSMRFASLSDVPLGTYVAIGRPDRRFTLSLDGDRLRLDEVRGGRAAETRYPTLSPSGRGLTLPGHHGVTFAREGGAIRMDVLFCYEHVPTRREAAR